MKNLNIMVAALLLVLAAGLHSKTGSKAHSKNRSRNKSKFQNWRKMS